jgi:hypothetical protein
MSSKPRNPKGSPAERSSPVARPVPQPAPLHEERYGKTKLALLIIGGLVGVVYVWPIYQEYIARK